MEKNHVLKIIGLVLIAVIAIGTTAVWAVQLANNESKGSGKQVLGSKDIMDEKERAFLKLAEYTATSPNSQAAYANLQKEPLSTENKIYSNGLEMIADIEEKYR